MIIAVDANRDGSLKLASEDASDVPSAVNPYRFWLNDDIDRGHTVDGNDFEQDDISPTEAATNSWDEDWKYNTVPSRRDLEDFARIVVSTSGLSDAFRNGDLYLGLKWTDTVGTPAIKLYRSTDTQGSSDYLFDTSASSQQSLGAAIIDARYPDYMGGSFQSDHTLIEGSEVFVIPTLQFINLTESSPRTNFIFEACKTGKGRLDIVILKKEGTNYTEIGTGPGAWLELKEPKDFIERWSCGNDDLGEVLTVFRESSKSASPAWDTPTTDAEKDYVLYVHGYNMQDFEKQRWIETTYKRLYWLGYKGRVGGFTWPCARSAPPYDASEERAWETAVQLKTLLSSLKTAGYRVHVIGHSQGNVVVGEALRQWAETGNTTPLVSTYIASQAAIEAHCYDTAAALIPGFAGSATDSGTPNVYANYMSTGNSYMNIATMGSAAAKWLNFENPQDYALTGNSLDSGDLHPGWQVNQRLKPDDGFGYDSELGFFDSRVDPLSPLDFSQDRFVIFSYVAEGRSLALGSTTTDGVFTGNNTDLSTMLSYGLEHLYHSAQFRASNAERYEYWQLVMQAADLTPLGP